MFIEMERRERQILIDLVEQRIHKLQEELRVERETGMPASLSREDLERLECILRHLHETEFDVTC